MDTKLRCFLMKYGLRQNVCAAAIGVSPGHFSDVVGGKAPSPALAEKICRFLNAHAKMGDEKVEDRLGEMDLLYPDRV